MKKSAICFTCILTALLWLSSPVTGEPLSGELPSPVFAPIDSNSFSLLEAPASTVSGQRPSIRPNTSLSKRGALESFCFSPVDTVTHYVGATIGDSSDGETRPDTVTEEDLLSANDPWTLQIGAGVERQLSNRATFDLDYRYTSAPMELDLDSLKQTDCDGHSISAGFKFLF